MSDTLIICIALMGALIFVLGANVTRNRAIRGKSGGPQMSTDPTDTLLIAVRAHGNASEYVPTLIGLLIVCSTLTDGWWLNAVAVAASRGSPWRTRPRAWARPCRRSACPTRPGCVRGSSPPR